MCSQCPSTSTWNRGSTWDPDPWACAFFNTYSVNFVKWSSQGMLRMSCEAMNDLFQPTVSGIIQHIGKYLSLGPSFTSTYTPRCGNILPC